MELLRRIGRHEVLIETSEPCGISLDEETLKGAIGAEAGSLTKKALLSALSSGDDEYLPLTLQWELLDKCNFACPFCYIVGHSAHRVVRFSDIRNHILDLIQEGLLFCTLTGGEVTIHPDFKEIYSLLKTNGVIVEVFTNGHMLDPSTSELFHVLPPTSVEVSIYTLDDQRLHDVFGVTDPLGASRVLENVLAMRDRGVNVTCKTFINTLTVAEVPNIEAWCKENELPFYSSDSITAGYDGADLSEFQSSSARAPTSYRPSKPVCLPCKTKNYGSAINASFSLFPCPAIHLADCTYDIRKLGVLESLSRMKSFMRKFQDTEIQGSAPPASKCASCIAFAQPVRNKLGEITHFAQPSAATV